MIGCGAGIVIVDPQGLKSQVVIKFQFQTSNIGAKYEALIRGAEMAAELGAQGTIIFSDSQLVTQQVNGDCEAKDPQDDGV